MTRFRRLDTRVLCWASGMYMNDWRRGMVALVVVEGLGVVYEFNKRGMGGAGNCVVELGGGSMCKRELR